MGLRIKACAKPFDNFAELIVELGNSVQAHQIGNSAIPNMEITLVPPARISRGEIRDGVLFVDVVGSPALNRSKVGLALKLFAAKGTQVQRPPPPPPPPPPLPPPYPLPLPPQPLTDEGSWSANGNLITGSFSYPVPDMGLIQVFLTYDGEFLGSWWARDHLLSFSLRSAIHRAIDPDGAFVARFFNDRNVFEEHVLILLSLLRLDCLYYGNIAELKDGPDILAISDRGHLYVIECTTGDINSKGKLRRLYERTNSIRHALSNSPHRPREILAVMITSSDERETLHCIDELLTYQIALITRERIMGLLNQIEAPPNADKLFAAAIETIPKPRPAPAE